MTQNGHSRYYDSIDVGLRASLPYLAKLVLTAMLLSYTAVSCAANPAYDYTVFAKTGDVVAGVTLNDISRWFIADDGSVLFVAQYNSCCQALFYKRSATARGSILVRQGDSIGGVPIFQFTSIKKNDRGEIVFSATIDNGVPPSVGIFRLKSAVALPGETIGGFTLNNQLFRFDLNDSGEIVFDGISGSFPNATYGILTPHRVIVQTGDVIDGLTLQNLGGATLSKTGVVAFSSSFVDSLGQPGSGIFTQHRLVFKAGDTIDGLFIWPDGTAVSEIGVVSFGFNYTNSYTPGTFVQFQQGVVVGGAIAVKSGDVIDGLTIEGQPDGIPFGYSLNANGEVLFTTYGADSTGTQVFGLFTQHHLVATEFSQIEGFPSGLTGPGSINDAGQIAFPIALAVNQIALIVATPNGN